MSPKALGCCRNICWLQRKRYQFCTDHLKRWVLNTLWREWTSRGVYLATASNWKDPATYNQHLDRGELFPDLGTAGTEDP